MERAVLPVRVGIVLQIENPDGACRAGHKHFIGDYNYGQQ